MDNINLEKVYVVLEYIDKDPKKEIDFIIKDYADEDVFLDFDDIDLNVQYSYVIKDKYKKIELTEEELKLVTGSLVGYMSRKIAARINAKNKAYLDSHLEKFIDFYGTRSSAFEHLFDIYLKEYGYNIKMEDIVNELLETKQKKK